MFHLSLSIVSFYGRWGRVHVENCGVQLKVFVIVPFFGNINKKSKSLVNMTSTEENAPENVEEPKVEEKVKKERSDAQKAVLEKARFKRLEVRLQKAKDMKEAKEQALLQVAEMYKTKQEVVEVEKFEPPEPEPEPGPGPPKVVKSSPGFILQN